MSAWTKGPWYYEHVPGRIPDINTKDSYGSWSVASANSRRDEYIANAHLIAAAPELAEACEALMELGIREGWDHMAINAARAALRKARGEG